MDESRWSLAAIDCRAYLCCGNGSEQPVLVQPASSNAIWEQRCLRGSALNQFRRILSGARYSIACGPVSHLHAPQRFLYLMLQPHRANVQVADNEH
jgi:hypothetical protein